MKKTSLLIFSAICCFSTISSQQTFDFGIKAGINYNSNGELYAQADEFSEVFIDESTGRVGYNLGIWVRKEFSSNMFLQPEIQYTHTKSTYKKFNNEDYILNKIEIPILIGFKIAKIASIFAGPNLQFIIDSSFENIAQSDIETDSFSLASHIGVGVDIGKLGLDIRWEKGLSNTKSSILYNSINIDSKSNQLICSLKYLLN
jgi:hypothetical protein